MFDFSQTQTCHRITQCRSININSLLYVIICMSPCSRFETCWFQIYLLSVTLQLFQNLLVSGIFVISHLVVVSEVAGFMYICYQSPCSCFGTCWFQVYLLSVALQSFRNLLVSGIFVISRLVVVSELAGFRYICYQSPCSRFGTCWFQVYLLSVTLQLFQNLLVSCIFVISRLVVVSELAGFRYICYQSPCSCFGTCWFHVYLLSVTLQLFQNLLVSGIFVISHLVVVSELAGFMYICYQSPCSRFEICWFQVYLLSVAVQSFQNLLVSGIFVISRLVVVSELAGFRYICYQSPCSRFEICWFQVYLLSVAVQSFQNLLVSGIFVISHLVVVSELAGFRYNCYQSPCSCFRTCWFHVYLLSVALQSFQNQLVSGIFVISRLVVVSELAGFRYICYQSPCSRFGTCWVHVYLLSVTVQLFQNLMVSGIFVISHLVVVSELAGFMYICYQSPCSRFGTCQVHVYLLSVTLQLFQNLLLSGIFVISHLVVVSELAGFRYICYQSPCSCFRTCWFEVYLSSVTLQLFQNLLVSCIFVISRLVVVSELAGFRYICYQSPCSCFRTCWFQVYLLSVTLQLFQNLLVSGIFVISHLVVVSELAGFRYICYQSRCSCFRTCWFHVYLLSVTLQLFQNLLVSCIFVISRLVVVSELAGFMYICYQSPCSCFRTCWFQVYLLSVALQLFQNLLVSGIFVISRLVVVSELAGFRYICYQSPCSCFRTCWFQVYLLSVTLQSFQNLLVSGIFVISRLVVVSELAGFMYICYQSPCSCFGTCWFHVYFLSFVYLELAGFRYISYHLCIRVIKTCCHVSD